MMPLLLLITWAAHYQSGASLRAPAWPPQSALPSLLLVGDHVAVVSSRHVARHWPFATRCTTRVICRRFEDATDFLNLGNVVERVSVYWDYFNPAYLFFSGGSNLSTATRKVGVFLLPVSVFLACGLPDALAAACGDEDHPAGWVRARAGARDARW